MTPMQLAFLALLVLCCLLLIGMVGLVHMFHILERSAVFHEAIGGADPPMSHGLFSVVFGVLGAALIVFHVLWVVYHLVRIYRESCHRSKYNLLLHLVGPLIATVFLLLNYSLYSVWYLVITDYKVLVFVKVLTAVVSFAGFMATLHLLELGANRLKQQVGYFVIEQHEMRRDESEKLVEQQSEIQTVYSTDTT